jgi:hypothetical protein
MLQIKPAWSPDRVDRLQSYRDGNTEIYVMDADGSSPRSLSDNSARDWHPQQRSAAGRPGTGLGIVIRMPALWKISVRVI